MLKFVKTTSECFSKDAFVCAPSVNCAVFSDNNVNSVSNQTHNVSDAFANVSVNIILMTGIAAAVSVFLFFIISIIAYGIIICNAISMINSIISAIIIFAIGIIINRFYLINNTNISAKLC